MNNQKVILYRLIWLDLIISVVTTLTALFLGSSVKTVILIFPIAVDVYCFYLLRKEFTKRVAFLTIINIIFSIFLVDMGFKSGTGTFLYYIPVIIGMYLFDAMGSKRIVRTGIILILISSLLVNLGYSPKLTFETLTNYFSKDSIFFYNFILSLFCSMVALQLFSNLRKKSVDDLDIRDANFLALMETSRDAVWSVDKQFNLMSFNAVYARMYRKFWKKAPLAGTSILFRESRHKTFSDWNNWYKRGLSGESFTFDMEYRFRDGRKSFEVSFTPILVNGKVEGTVVRAIDISQRKKELYDQQHITGNLELLLSSTQEIIFEMDEFDRCKKVWTGEGFDLYYPMEYFMGKTISELFDQPFKVRLSEIYYKVKYSGIPAEIEYQHTLKGVQKFYLAKIRRIKNSAPARASIVIEEITHRKEIELRNEQQTIFLNKLIAHLPLGIFVKSVKQNLKYTLWNRELENIFGIEEKEVLGKTDIEIFNNSGEISYYLETDRIVLEEKEPILIQKLRIQSGEKDIYARTFKIPILDQEGNVELILGILENITEMVYSQQELENAERRWNYALSGSRDAVWDLNLESDETYFSPMLNEILGYEPDEQIRSKWEDLVHPDDLRKAWKLFADHLEGKSDFYECEYRMLCKNGNYIWILDRGKVAETDEAGNPIRIIGTYSNIDYRKKLEEEYKVALGKAQEASKAKGLFLSTMSHEIRTPMNGVIGIINLLLSENPKPEQRENLQALKYSADNLMFLLNDILDFSKIDAGKLDIEETSFNLYSMLQNTLKSFVTSANEKGLQLQLKASNNFPSYMKGDVLRLNQIFNNLISNAIKFTQKGKITVEAIHEGFENNRVNVKFVITDSGIGISDKFLPTIFDQFTQASSDTTRKYGGTGLGLAICKRLVEIMGGEIAVESRLGEGTSFTIRFAFQVASEQPVTIEETEQIQNPDFEGMQVLLVEDNQMNVFVARKFLDKWKIAVEVAGNGREAIQWVRKKKFDLILMDLQMPEMDGFEATRIIRRTGIRTPIFALSANVDMDVKKQVADVGMNDYLSKPFNPEELYKKISNCYSKPSNKPKLAPLAGDLFNQG